MLLKATDVITRAKKCIILLMYSGTTFRPKSGNVIGVHQKIDRVARRNLCELPGNDTMFPRIREILHFEGNNGPDGIKRKSPSADEPWHFVDPSDPSDREIVTMVTDHHHNLIKALKEHNRERAAYEAAWMSHAISDGLTPAHHYRLSDEIEKLWGKPKEQRLTVVQKNVILGHGAKGNLTRNWKYWGAKGIFMTHVLFEFGIATAIKSTTFPDSAPAYDWLAAANKKGLAQVFEDAMQEVYALDMYQEYWKNGWTPKLARKTRLVLMPIIIRTVTYAWYSALQEAER